MKNVITCIVLFTTTSCLHAQGTWERIVLKRSDIPTVINIPAGKVLETTAPIFEAVNTTLSLRYDLGNGDVITDDDFTLLRPNLSGGSTGIGFFVGPSSLSLQMSRGVGNSFVLIQYRLLDNPALPSAVSSALMLPAGASGPTTVKLQTSTNLKDWASVASQEFSPESGNRYFRISAGE